MQINYLYRYYDPLAKNNTKILGGDFRMVMDIVAIAFIAFVIYGMCKNDTEVENDGRINKAR